MKMLFLIFVFTFVSLLFRPIEVSEAKNLLSLMRTRDIQILEKVLVTISNLATFTPNQVCIFILILIFSV